jgi:hypothetical protein
MEVEFHPYRRINAQAHFVHTIAARRGALPQGNRPIDMIACKKDNHDYILMASSARGVIKASAGHLEIYKPITAPSDIAGVPHQAVSGLTGVTRLTSLDDSKALILTESNGAIDLRSVRLP